MDYVDRVKHTGRMFIYQTDVTGGSAKALYFFLLLDSVGFLVEAKNST